MSDERTVSGIAQVWLVVIAAGLTMLLAIFGPYPVQMASARSPEPLLAAVQAAPDAEAEEAADFFGPLGQLARVRGVVLPE